MTKKQAGAGRGFVNPQRTDESDSDYITPEKRYEMEKQVQEAKESSKNEAEYNKATTVGKAKGGMTASSRADGCCTKGKTRGKMV